VTGTLSHPAASITLISSSVNPYNLYTSAPTCRSVASISRRYPISRYSNSAIRRQLTDVGPDIQVIHLLAQFTELAFAQLAPLATVIVVQLKVVFVVLFPEG